MIFLLIFGGVGLLFFVLGLIFLIMEFRKKFRNDKLLKSGNYVMAEISEVELNYNVTVNMRHPLKQNFVKKFQKPLAQLKIIMYTIKCCGMIAVKREVAAISRGTAGFPWSECQEAR